MLMSGVRVVLLQIPHSFLSVVLLYYCTTEPQETAVHLQFKSAAGRRCVVLNGNDISPTVSAQTQAVACACADVCVCVCVPLFDCVHEFAVSAL